MDSMVEVLMRMLGLIVMLLNNQQKGGGQCCGNTCEHNGVNCYVVQQS